MGPKAVRLAASVIVLGLLGVNTDDSTRDLTGQVTWASSASTVAAVSNAAGSNGLVTTAGVGSTTVSATSSAVSSSTILTVTPAAPSVDQQISALLAAVTNFGTGNSLANKLTAVPMSAASG